MVSVSLNIETPSGVCRDWSPGTDEIDQRNRPMKIKTQKQAEQAYDELHQFYKDEVDRAIKAEGKGGPEKLSKRLGYNSLSVVRSARDRGNFGGLKAIVDRLAIEKIGVKQ